MIALQIVPTHYLVAVEAVVGYLQPNWKYFQWNYSELQQLLLAVNEQMKR
jgi:hypothetical protein